ncbi:hypothetical protein J5U23_01358 [Saccharolobus shibatae B12]|uniref:SpoVT-AbrB domain-containing protein n=1 Tax=Saccharolobus shibatae (strain ATCC 51178 / DSM 5389 / JCM 8931 / NBRC 15437 / B12) TaxID=523848 RepID=A0A8F5BNC2_SACSH|nr:hypothetical protein [Saccharolobus shibatae]QXJ28489.1 hypothetical protein J5U23_01358 [Saccharolobus shibatae B12]
MGKEFILKIDDRGRITIPKEVRELIKSKSKIAENVKKYSIKNFARLMW